MLHNIFTKSVDFDSSEKEQLNKLSLNYYGKFNIKLLVNINYDARS